MTADRALELDQFQERLEVTGWRFTSHYIGDQFVWFAYKPTWGLSNLFARAGRDDARAHALQWAHLEDAAVNERRRDTLPVPAPEVAAE